MMGSPYYMSPEQMESPREVDARTDIWSLGVVLYQLLTGKVPFAGETLPQVCVNVATRSPAPLREHRSDVPNGLEAVLQRCLEKDPAQRYPSIAALATALSRFGSRHTQTSLDRILRVGQDMPDAGEADIVTHHRGATDRPVTTGPLPSWGSTAIRSQKRTRNLLGWSAMAFCGVALAATWARRQWAPDSATKGAILVTPSKNADSSEIASAAALQPLSASPQPPAGSPPSAPLTPSTWSAPARLAPPNRQPIAAAPPDEPARPNLAPSPPTDQEMNPYLSAPETAKSSKVVETCLLNLSATPAATVVVDGTPLGFTPKKSVPVPVGEHYIRFRWSDGDRRQVINCTRGETKTITARPNDAPSNEELPEKNPYR
jgi:serine/threonine-protein kinase